MSKFSKLAAGAANQQPPAAGAPPYPSQQHYPGAYPPPPSSNPYSPPPPPPRQSASPQPGQPPYQQPQYQPYQPQQQASPYGQPPSQYGAPQYGQQQQQQQRPPYGQPPPQQFQYGQPQQHQLQSPPQGSYGQPYGGYGQPQGPPPGQGYPPQGGPPPGQGYGAPQAPPAGPHQVQAYKDLMHATIQERGLQSFYPPNSPAIDQIASHAAAQVDKLCQAWRIQREIGQDIVKLALYDVILYIDDSGSMAFEENGERIDDLKLIVQRVAFAASLFDSDGIQVRFMNSPEQGNHIRNDAEVIQLIQRIKFKGLTPMGSQLRQKVVDPHIVQPARSGSLKKPVLVITITDGQPAGEPTGAVFDTIKHASSELSRSRYGKGAVSFQFAQVGNDLKAREFLGKLDEEPGVGELVDCTSNFEVEQDEMSRANPPVDLTPELWLIKLLLGAIDSSYDTKDEKSHGRPPPGGPGGYGAPPPQQQYGGYPPQQQGYGRPPPGQPGYPPQGGYGGPPQPPRY